MDEALSVWIAFGDIHDDVAMASRIPEIAAADGVIVTGDLTVRGDALAAERVLAAIEAVNPNILAQIGNMDRVSVQERLQARGIDLHLAGRELAPGVGIMGVGWSTPTPFGTPSEVSDAQLERWLDEAYASVARFPRFVLVSHTPPHGTAADRLRGGAHVGSPAVRRFIEQTRPAVCLTGHIHESRAMDRIGPTVVVNPGALAHGGYVRLEIRPEAVEARLLNA